MKNIKIIVLTVIVSVGLTISGSVFGAIFLVPSSTGSSNTQTIPKPSNVENNTINKLSEAEQIAKGYKFNIYTGQKLVEQISTTEARFRAIEKRLDLLEANR